MMKLHLLQHVPFEGPGRIADWAAARNVGLSVTRLFCGESLPGLSGSGEEDGGEGVVVMGGPMNIYQHRDFPWLLEEKRFLENAIVQGRKVLGVCLGAQLLASVLGAQVYQNPAKEIGWFDVGFTPFARSRFDVLPERLPVLHWHGDTFDLPRGAQQFAESRLCRNQGFTAGKNVLALQFHLEAGVRECRNLIEHCGDELETGGGEKAGNPGENECASLIHCGEEIEAGALANAPAAEALLFKLLDRFFLKKT